MSLIELDEDFLKLVGNGRCNLPLRHIIDLDLALFPDIMVCNNEIGFKAGPCFQIFFHALPVLDRSIICN